MASYEEVLRAARGLPAAEQQQLARALAAGPAAARGAELPLAALAGTTPRPHTAAWVKAERGHAVLATTADASGADVPTGAPAIAGMWADLRAPSGNAE